MSVAAPNSAWTELWRILLAPRAEVFDQSDEPTLKEGDADEPEPAQADEGDALDAQEDVV